MFGQCEPHVDMILISDGLLATRVSCTYTATWSFLVEMLLRDLSLGAQEGFHLFLLLKVGGITCLLADGHAPLQREDCCCRSGRVAGGMSWSRREGLGSSAQVEGLVTS